ncbi:MAG: cell division protein FtsZ [Candidatus Poribacteria bacterium]|nr:cell division protein FtsZ [Candidatus Poribacteria bacterium]
MLEFENEKQESEAIIKVIGVGGAGGNAINTMIANDMRGVSFISVNTDVKDLRKCKAPEKIQIGCDLTRGLGAGADPQVGQKSAQEDRNKLQEIVNGADMVFIAAGLGGGTGTGASPVVAEIARSSGALTVAVVTRPFIFEGAIRSAQAEDGIKELKNHVDALIVIPNQRLIDAVDKGTSIIEAFRMADDILFQGVQSISDLIMRTGYIVVDFNDVKTIMQDAGTALMGIGIDSGDSRSIRAAQKAISSPLLEETTIQGARGLLVNITGNRDMGILEVNEAMSLIHGSVDPGANVIWGMVFDDSLDDKIKVTVIATGFDGIRKERTTATVVNSEKEGPWDLDEILKNSFGTKESVRRKRSLMRGGINNANSENGVEEELEIPSFLRNKRGNKISGS